MSLGDIYSKVNSNADSLYANQKDRIMREANERKKQLEKSSADMKQRDLNSKKFEQQRIKTQIASLRREITLAGGRDKDSAMFKRVAMEKERKIKSLEQESSKLDTDMSRLESDLRMKRY